MRFFTLNWWRGRQTGDASNPCANSGRHLDAVRARLPADLLALQGSISLHDARLRRLGVPVGHARGGLLSEDEPPRVARVRRAVGAGAEASSFDALLKRTAEAGNVGRQVIFTTSDEKSPLEKILAGLDCNYVRFDGKVLRPVEPAKAERATGEVDEPEDEADGKRSLDL